MHEITSYNTDLNENVNMIEITQRAMRLLNDFFKDTEKKPVRIFVKLGGCGIRSFGVALEKQKKSDETININGYTFIVDKKLWDQVKPIKIDADRIAFRISGNGIQPNSGCGACSFMCGVSGSGRCIGDCDSCKLLCANSRKIGVHNRQN